MDSLSTELSPTSRRPATDALDRLTGLGWSGGLAAILLALAASFALLGYTTVYWRHADMDFMVIYSSLALNDGQPQQFFDHPAYLTIVAVRLWLKALHTLGLLDAASLGTLPPASDVAAFDAAMTHVVRAARLVSFATTLAFVSVFAVLVRRLVRDWRVALLATFAFAFSGGIAVHLRILRSELIAACFVLFALMLLIAAGRRASTLRPLVAGSAAALCVLALENKVHAILLIAALPVLLLPFGGPESASKPFWRSGFGWGAALATALVAALAVTAAAPLVASGLDPAALAAAGLKPALAGRIGIVQAGMIAWSGAGMMAYALTWRISAAETITSMGAMLTGASLALLTLLFNYNINDIVVVLNPLEKMLSYVDASGASATSGGPAATIWLILDGIRLVLMRLTFVLYSSPRPTVFLTWLILPGIIYGWRRGERQAALQATLLLGAAIGIDALGVRRGLKSEYFVFTDPLIILAGAVLLDRLADLARLRLAYPIAIALMVLHVTISQAEPVRYALKRSGPQDICEWNVAYMPRLPVPWCAEPKPAP
ncbi:hypothetical protein [Bradyrhizobium sp. WD16]|uniref:hypothetical protein n=1 Tax=Bradyrhizobium sp. WD16 TaxID=1521768 RepID=UPI0020A5F892|nr:hypothetical protein [Bradyrhizobium sp. WD16]UTD29400.1 hypothetical protein DB459_23285 [Bradyrhizobium sp. WD16]